LLKYPASKASTFWNPDHAKEAGVFCCGAGGAG